MMMLKRSGQQGNGEERGEWYTGAFYCSLSAVFPTFKPTSSSDLERFIPIESPAFTSKRNFQRLGKRGVILSRSVRCNPCPFGVYLLLIFLTPVISTARLSDFV